MFPITKRPIVILSAPRTGSTVLGEYIKKMCDDRTINYFAEPEHEENNLMEKFLTYYHAGDNYIVKTHLYNINKFPANIAEFFTTSDSVFRIRLLRRSFVDQVTSYYIAVARNKKWVFQKNKDRDYEPDTIEIDKQLLEHHIRFVYRCNLVLRESQLNFDLNLYYEDFPAMNNVNIYKNPRPTNYKVIWDTSREIMSQMRDRNL